MSITTFIRRSLPARAASAGLQAARTGIEIAAIPVREGARALTGDLPHHALRRRCWRGNNRAWIEVRGLADAADGELGRAVLDALRGHPGVRSVSLNHPLSRVVVGIGDPDTPLRDLCRLVETAERREKPRRASEDEAGAAGAANLPGDGIVLATKALTMAANAAGLGVALTGRAMRLPPLPAVVGASVTFFDYQPWLRRLLEDAIGRPGTDTVLTLAHATSHALSQSLTSLSIGLTMQSLQAAEVRAGAQLWERHEPELARHADQPRPPTSPRPRPSRGAERSVRRFALLQALSAGAIGVGTRNPNMVATAVAVTTPKASRTTPEAFATTLARGLAERHAVLAMRPESVRRLDKVDAIVIDPRILCTDALRVARIRGAEGELSAAWNRALLMLETNGLRPGWRPVPGASGGRQAAKLEALFVPAHDPLAAAVVAEAHRTGAELVTLDTDALDELRPAFDDIRPLRSAANGSSDRALDNALARAVADLQQAGRRVAVLSSAGAQALSAADVALGVLPRQGPPPWQADLLLPDLEAAWRVLHALPAARAAAQRGIGISAGATAMGSLFMIPGVRGNLGPQTVNVGAAAGLLSGYLLARGTLNADTPRPAAAHEWHAMSVEQVRKALPDGHSGEAAVDVGRPYHPAAQPKESLAQSIWQLAKAVRAELSDPLTPVMALGSAASAVLGSPVDAVLVGTVLTGNSILAAAQRLRAEKRLSHLLALQIPPARRVLTGPDGRRCYADVDATQLRPGDVIEVRTHEVVPADARIIEQVDVEVDESALTGESLSVDKQVEATPGAPLAERRCMLFAGTTVVAGTAVALVTAVGADTQQRRAAELISGELSSDIGLQHQLGQLTTRALPVSITGGALVGALGLVRRLGLQQAVSSAIAIAVAAVPEGMPLVATLAQAASARRLTKFGALVRVPRSVEALGRIEVVCFDKTGTLSENRLRVSEVRPAAGSSEAAKAEVLRCAAHAAPWANGGPQAHATDVAILEAAGGQDAGAAPRTAHLPFRSGRAFSASATGTELTVKGAPEVVLAACGDRSAAASVHDTVAAMAAKGLRVIAVARRRLSPQQAKAIRDDPDRLAGYCKDGLTLTGFLGLSDTPRPESAGLIGTLRSQGVGIKLITGDHPITATAIAEELGLPVTPEQVISGAEWDSLSRKEQERVVTERVIFARMTPENKVQVVQTLESAGVRTAMVGDGANDAAAIRAATVGIGVVAHGSDPAHLVADVVLVDGRIDALLEAIEEGRQLWRRVQAAVSVLLGGNAGEVIFALVGSAITGTSPLNTRQLLLVNTITDALPAAALAVSKPRGAVDPNLRGADQPALWHAVAVRGVTTAAAATAAWAMAGVTGRPQRASTVALVALVGTELGQTVLESQAPMVVVTALGSLAFVGTLISIPGVSQLLGCTPIGPLGWAQGLGAAAAATAAVAVVGPRFERRDRPDAGTAPEASSSEPGEGSEQGPAPQPARRATAAHKAPAGARPARRLPSKPSDRSGRRSSTYSRR
ncbi:haloacid dehalogenase [Mycobacterium alsense]|uniref:Cation-translocating P-type ATPase n=1 Tax=Mycobacterium alsense TaxID=324058 RepID=A0AA42BYH4_9MYCO|nr:cation-translocating P-type ATPase [Mycobacterium alsense]OQZ90867.1 haloacid dehalogenase [Mycobacterium alsense]